MRWYPVTDQIFDALSNDYRRQLLIDLLEENPRIVATQPGASKGRLRAETMIQTRHIHLPKLVDYGFIDWDRDQRLVTKGARFDEIRPVLELLYENRDRLPVDWA